MITMIYPKAALACATCAIDAGSQTSHAATTAVMFMVGLVAVVLSVFLYAIISFARKQKRFQPSNT